MVVYSRSKVADAVGAWRKYKENIDQELKKYNGFGLPATYILEEDVNEWDYFDVFVAGWIWAHTIYDGKHEARVQGQRSPNITSPHRQSLQLKGIHRYSHNEWQKEVVDAFMWKLHMLAWLTIPGWEKWWSNEDIWWVGGRKVLSS